MLAGPRLTHFSWRSTSPATHMSRSLLHVQPNHIGREAARYVYLSTKVSVQPIPALPVVYTSVRSAVALIILRRPAKLPRALACRARCAPHVSLLDGANTFFLVIYLSRLHLSRPLPPLLPIFHTPRFFQQVLHLYCTLTLTGAATNTTLCYNLCHLFRRSWCLAHGALTLQTT